MCKMLHNEKSYLTNSWSDQRTKLLKENERRGCSRERVVGQGGQRTTADLCDRFQGQGGRQGGRQGGKQGGKQGDAEAQRTGGVQELFVRESKG